MCGRYFIDGEMEQEIGRIVSRVDAKLNWKERDVHPSELAPVIRTVHGAASVEPMKWGILPAQGKGLLINARAETALEKRTFRESILHRRCVALARKFYEWNRQKEMAVFEKRDAGILYLAGFYDISDRQDCFVLLTTAANESVLAVHHRMPLILEADEWPRWLDGTVPVEEFLKKQPEQLKRYQEYEQQTFSFL